MKQKQQKLLSIRQMAELLDMQPATFHCKKSAGDLPLGWVKIDRAVFATQASFIGWLGQKAARAASKAEELNAIIASLEGETGK